jgi:pyridoxal phosphate enzyme (YggS family)
VTQITDHLSDIHRRVTQALLRAGRRENDAIIVAVAKQHSADAVRAVVEAGQKHIGESFVAEALAKQEALKELSIVWHFIGHVQANKTRSIAEHFDWVHSVERIKIARRLNDQRAPSQPALNVLIQVNQANEPQKSGVPPDQVEQIARDISALPRLTLRGLMTIPPAESNDAERSVYFAGLRDLAAQLVAAGLPVDTLSMGMSDDFELALAQGSTCVRIGTAIFGPREPLATEGPRTHSS